VAGFVILGGGLTGLVAAERLAAAGHDIPVFEREPEAGGACRSIERDGFTFDHTGHLLHVARPETEQYLQQLGVWDRLEVHERRAAIVVGDHVTPYPIQINTGGLAAEVRRDCLLGFIRSWAKREDADTDPENFRDWVLERFGEGFARHFFFPYNEKLYRARVEDLSLDWVGRYVPKPDLEEVVDGALGLHDRPVGYNAVFRYPAAGGIRILPDAVAAAVPDLRLNTEVVEVHLGERWIATADGQRHGFDRLVSTVSLAGLLAMVSDPNPMPEDVVAARSALRWVRVLNVALGVAGDPPSDEHWLYFPDRELPFYRVGFPSNHGRLAPDGCHTVSIEVSLDPAGSDVQDAARAAERALAAAGFLDPDRIKVRQLTVVDPAYVVFDHRRRGAVSLLRRYLADHGVMISGRWAEWKYSAMEDAVLDGMTVARRLSKHGRR
jgi:protoporphyrinogen oxidase